MPLYVVKSLIRFEGVCGVEEALPLSELLRARKPPKIDLSQCTYLHCALLQLLLLARPKIAAPPEDPFLARRVLPLLVGPKETT